jgi:hypothetical protein
MKKIITICSPSIASKSMGQPAPQPEQQEQQEQQESISNEVRVSLLVDKYQVPWAFPQRKFSQKPCTSACEHPPVSSLTFGRDFTPPDVASKRCRPKRRPSSSNLRDHLFGQLFWPKSVIAQGQGRVDCCSHVSGVHRTRTKGFALKAKKTKAKSVHRCGRLPHVRSSVSCAFVVTRQAEMKNGAA